MNRLPRPPQADARPVSLRTHGRIRRDLYYWLQDRDDPKVLDYLKEENRYTEAAMAHTRNLRRRLFEEIRGRIQQTDTSVPFRFRDYLYYHRFEDGQAYPIYCRRAGETEEEEILLDVNQMASGHEFFDLADYEVSSGQDLLAYAFDTTGRRIHTIGFKELSSGRDLPDRLRETTGDMVWANDNRTLFYTRQDPSTLRASRVYKHVVGTDPELDELVYEEADETFSLDLESSKSRKYILIACSQTLSTEYLYLDADTPGGRFQVFLGRRADHEYQIDHHGRHFYIRTNQDARNFRLMRTSQEETDPGAWEEVLPHREETFVGEFELFDDFVVVSERCRGLTQIRVQPRNGEAHYLDFREPAYLADLDANFESDTPLLRFVYTSMTTPASTFQYHMGDRRRTLLKETPVLGGFRKDDYVTERHFATTDDDSEVPISLVYRKETPKDGSAPLLLYAYGSYGISLDAGFSPARLSLLDRGFVFAIAHVRGGQEMGRAWYEGGRLLNKKKTFTDFLDCADYLLEKSYTSKDRLFAQGGSAGGLLIGAVANMRPLQFKAMVAKVPFVDVVTTMLDDSIPLTTGEYDEWGNPHDPTFFDYMLSYSPYDNVEARDYPALLVTAGLHDSQVQYWEPAKWVAKLRATKTDGNLLLLKTNMEAGHGGASGRYKQYEEIAFDYAFLIDQAGLPVD